MKRLFLIIPMLFLLAASAGSWTTYRDYKNLIELLRQYTEEDDWDTAYRCARAQASTFRDDPYYRDLMRVLGAPADTVYSIRRLPDWINTSGNEFVPTVTGDGKTMYFCGSHRKDSLGMEDIYMCQKENGEWGRPVLVRELSTPNHNEAPVSISADGTTLICFVDGVLYSTDKTANGWSPLQPLPAAINIARWQADASLTADGNAILFAAYKENKWESEVSVNIFVSERDSLGNWQTPQELGPAINTIYGDRAPQLHPDGKTLYFCSEGHSTLGGYDVFKATKVYENSWQHWTQPENLGRQINTIGKDCWYRISTDGTRAWFARNNNGNDDIYEVILPLEARPEAVFSISGWIADESGQPAGVEIRWEDLETGASLGIAKSDPTNGAFFIALPKGRHYGYYVNDRAYFPVADHLDLRADTAGGNLQHDIRLQSIAHAIATQEPIRLTNLFFAVNEATILPESYSELRRVARLISERELHVEISGHTDASGNAALNKDLSRRRAEAVRTYLIEQGCPAELLTAVGYGAERPVATNDTEEGKAANRRVELRLLQ